MQTHMTPEQFKAAGVAIYGRIGWQTQLAADLGVARGTVNRYAQSVLNIPTTIALAVEALRVRAGR